MDVYTICSLKICVTRYGIHSIMTIPLLYKLHDLNCGIIIGHGL
jgi:hypothetical protein